MEETTIISAPIVESTVIGSDPIGPSSQEYISYEKKTIENTAVKTSCLATTLYKGDNNIPANSVKAGDILEFKSRGKLWGINGTTATLELTIGGVVVNTSTVTLPNITNMSYRLDVMVVIIEGGATGSVRCVGETFIQTQVGLAAPIMRSFTSDNDVSIDFTADNAFDVTYQFSSASTNNKLIVMEMQVKKYRVNE